MTSAPPYPAGRGTPATLRATGEQVWRPDRTRRRTAPTDGRTDPRTAPSRVPTPRNHPAPYHPGRSSASLLGWTGCSGQAEPTDQRAQRADRTKAEHPSSACCSGYTALPGLSRRPSGYGRRGPICPPNATAKCWERGRRPPAARETRTRRDGTAGTRDGAEHEAHNRHDRRAAGRRPKRPAQPAPPGRSAEHPGRSARGGG
jgi:hypothetical protein